MSRFLRSKLTLVGLLVSIFVVVLSVSAVMGSGSGASSGQSGEAPTIVAASVNVVVEGCSGEAHFDVFGSGFHDGEIVLITLKTESGRLFVGAGFPGGTGGFSDSIVAPVRQCGVMTVRAAGTLSSGTTAPINIVEHK